MAKNFQYDYLMLAIVPMAILLVTGWIGIKYTEKYIDIIINQSLLGLKHEADILAEKLAEADLENKNQAIVRQVEIYLRNHPNLSLEELQHDSFFLELSIQQEGHSEYTYIYDAPDGIVRIHPDPELIGKNVYELPGSLPAWRAIVDPTLSGGSASGYYEWEAPDGSTVKRYIHVVPLAVTVEGEKLLVAADIDLDEFGTSIRSLEYRSDAISVKYRRFAGKQALLSNLIALVVVGMIICVVYIVNHRTVFRYIQPIEKLSEAVNQIQAGNWNFFCSPKLLQRKDEIGALARAFSGMSHHLQVVITDLEFRFEEAARAQAACKESRHQYRSLFNSVPIGLYRTDPTGKIIDVNNALLRMLGLNESLDWRAYNAQEFYADPSQRSTWKEKVGAESGVYICEKEMRRFDGSMIWVEDQAHAVRDENGCVLFFEGFLKDITTNREAQRALEKNRHNYKVLYEESRRAQEVYRSLIGSSADAIIISDLSGHTQYVSPVFTQWFGWSLEELRGKPIPFVPESEKMDTEALMDELVNRGTACRTFITKRFTKNGCVIDVNISASRFDDHQNRPAGILTIMHDISEKKKLQAQLQHAERMEAIGTLAGGIAHDFNNLMMGMQGNISLLLCEMKSSHPFHDKLKSIENMIENGAKLTRHLLGYARKGKYEAQPMNLNKLVRETSETFGRTRRAITLHLQLADEICAIEADRTQIDQVLMNLYINAGDAMPDGGELMLKTQMVTHDQFGIKPYVPRPGKYALLLVTDTGEGIHPRHIKRIFDPFFTTKQMGRGTGLGLASVYGIIKAHGGYIDVTSKLGQGTTFHMYLPCTDAVVAESGREKENYVPGKGKILIVDDEVIVVEVSRDMLEKVGYSVQCATNGQEALSLFRSQADEIDLVILDMIMPRMGGGEVFDEIKAIRPKTKVLLASGYSIDGQAAQILKRGCDGFIQKPYSLQQLSRKIEEILSVR